jgi:hypothetical protein
VVKASYPSISANGTRLRLLLDNKMARIGMAGLESLFSLTISINIPTEVAVTTLKSMRMENPS